ERRLRVLSAMERPPFYRSAPDHGNPTGPWAGSPGRAHGARGARLDEARNPATAPARASTPAPTAMTENGVSAPAAATTTSKIAVRRASALHVNRVPLPFEAARSKARTSCGPASNAAVGPDWSKS